MNLAEADLRYANLQEAVLYGTNLQNANLLHANLTEANLNDASLQNAILRSANLYKASLYSANLQNADLHESCLNKAILQYADLKNADVFLPIACPEKGSFIAFKKASGGFIVELLIPEDAERSSATTRMCRCNKAKVISITTSNGIDSGIAQVSSIYDDRFIYRIGETVEVEDFDKNRWNECSTGIHFFLTREEAVRYISI